MRIFPKKHKEELPEHHEKAAYAYAPDSFEDFEKSNATLATNAPPVSVHSDPGAVRYKTDYSFAKRIIFLVLIGIVISLFVIKIPKSKSMNSQYEQFGFVRGAYDAKRSIHNVDDVDDMPTAMAFLSMQNELTSSSPENQELVKTAIEAKEKEQKSILAAFVKGYKRGFASVKP